jgi:ribosomal protein S20
MNISSVGASNSLDLISLLSKQSRSRGSGGGTVSDPASDTLSLSMQAKFLQGAQPFQADFQALGSKLQSGDLEGAKQVYAAMQDKIKGHQPPSGGDDPMAQGFAALGKALESGDTQAAQSAYHSMQTKMESMASRMGASTHGGFGANAIGQDMDQLGKLIETGDLDGANSLLNSMQSRMKAHPHPPQNAQGPSAGSSTDIESLFNSLGNSLGSNDLSSAQDTWSNLVKQLQGSGNTTLG